MYELTCNDCRLNDAPEGTQEVELPVRAYNRSQRYLCPGCGYAWTERRGAKVEDALLALAGNSFALAVALFAVFAAHWPPLGVLLTVASTYCLLITLGYIRSEVEDWLDPADSVARRA